MKKLLIILSCVAATVGLCAQDTFEDKELGAFTDNAKTESVWFVSDSTEAEIVEEATSETTSNKYLQIADSPSTDPLYRAYSVTLNSVKGDYEPVSVTVPSAGIYFDAKVQFSVSDTLDQGEVDYAKFAIFAYCAEDSTETNIVARAASYTGVNNCTAQNYFFALPEGVTLSPETWYRVTIKTIPLFETGVADGRYGFIAYLDGKLLTYGSDVSCGDDAFVNSLTATAKKYVDNKGLMPGYVTGSGAAITRVLFAGTGALDDVDWTTEAPEFAKDETLITLTWDAGVKSITFGGESVDVSAGTTTNIAVAAGTDKVNITATLNDGYAFSSSWENGEKDTTAPVTYAVKTYAYQVTVDGKAYEEIDDAVAAAIDNSKPLVLAKDLTKIVKMTAAGTLIIDLKGHDITISEDSGYEQPIYLGEQGCNLVITNSSAQVGTVCGITTKSLGGTYSIYAEAESVTVTVYENCKFEGDIYADPEKVMCYGGIFKQTDTTVTEFPYSYDKDNYTVTFGTIAGSEGNYWTVAKKTAKTPLEIFIEAIEAAGEDDTVTLTDNITLTDRIDVALSGKTVTIDLNGKTVKPTATCANGSAFNIVSGTVTFKNGTIDGTAIIDADVTAGNKECDPITVRSGASVTLVDGLTISICSKNGACVYPFDGGTVEITGGVYENSTTEAYDAIKGTDIVGLAVNQANVATQLITITGGKFKQYDPAKGDDTGKCTTFLASGYKSVLGSDGFYTVEVKNTPSTWTDVNPETQDLADVVADDQLEVIKAANITVSNLWAWATTHKVETAPGVDIDLEALTLNCAPGKVETAKEAFKATQEDLNAIITADKTGTDEDLVNAVKSFYEDTYPNATVTVEKITDENADTSGIYSTETLKLFRLKITLGRSE